MYRNLIVSLTRLCEKNTINHISRITIIISEKHGMELNL